MKILIVYASNHGTTAKVVEKLSRLIGYNRCKSVNIRETTPPALDNFNSVIIGGSVHYGRVQRKIRKYCEKNLDELLTKQIGLFICYINQKEEIKEYIDSYPAELIQHAHAEGFFGGELKLEKMNLLERYLVKKRLDYSESIRRIDSQSINHFAILMQESFEPVFNDPDTYS